MYRIYHRDLPRSGAQIRGLQNLEKFQKVLILFVRSRRCDELNRGLENLETPGKETDCHFLHRAKSNIKSTRDSVLRPRFKALPEKILTEVSDGTSRTRLFARNGGEKALNRCEVPALQRKDLERTTKEQPCSLQTVGYGWVRICDVCGGKGVLGMAIRKGLFK